MHHYLTNSHYTTVPDVCQDHLEGGLRPRFGEETLYRAIVVEPDKRIISHLIRTPVLETPIPQFTYEIS